MHSFMHKNHYLFFFFFYHRNHSTGIVAYCSEFELFGTFKNQKWPWE